MLRSPLRYGLLASLLSLPFILGSAGCGSSTTKPGPDVAPVTASNETDSDIAAELAKLPPEDRALAAKQKVCLVTDEPLGSMGVPTKVVLNGRTVFLCCGGCEKALKKNADKYLAKLDRAETK